ncbi:hypothetical protein COLO4_24592 [Corchorus olitorius]|uniref:Uncharacterized protein n=1 Tax=Corchorus olitorius TaxID=93759 RepID=A0A1R3I8V6_9ROSI|nr:hypothetical protein COLO4_24592 [Corchorus olitorius]
MCSGVSELAGVLRWTTRVPKPMTVRHTVLMRCFVDKCDAMKYHEMMINLIGKDNVFKWILEH